MSILQETFTESLNAGASPITYEGEEGREQQIAQALWDKLPPQARMQFGSFAQFFSSGAWKKVLAALQQQMQGGQEEIQETETVEAAPQQGLGSMMRGPRTMAHGGIMNAAPRQGYFLGSVGRAIGKAVGKVGDVAKQVVKSPVGRAALLGAGIYGLGGGFGPGSFGWGNIGPSIGRGLGALKGSLFGAQVPPSMGMTTPGILGKLGLTKGGGSMIPTALGWISGASLLGYFTQKGATEEEAEELAKDVYRGKGLGMDQIRADIAKYKSGEFDYPAMTQRGYDFLTPRPYLAAQGGRVELKDGTEKIPSSKKQRQEDYSLGMYEAGDIQKETPDRDIIKDFPGATQDMLASYLSKRKRGIPMDQVQTDLIQTYGLSNYSRFMKILKEEGLGDYKYKLGGTDLGPREMIEETTQYPEMAIGGRVGLKKGTKGKGPHGKTDKEVLEELYPTLFSDTTTSIEGSPKKKKYTKGRAQGGRIGYAEGTEESQEYIMDAEESMAIFKVYPKELSERQQNYLYGYKKYSKEGIFRYFGTVVEEPNYMKFIPRETSIWFGDSGGGIFAEFNDNKYLVGVISHFIIIETYGDRELVSECSAVIIAKYIDWINESVSDNDDDNNNEET